MKVKRVYQSDRQLKRQANILYMTRKMASRVGYDGLTMRNLAEAAEVSPKTLYNLFNSKDELLIAALDDLVGIIRESLVEFSDLKGFDHILSIRESSGEAIVRSPGFANVIVSLFFRAKPEERLVSTLLVGQQNETLKHLEYERQRGATLDINLSKLVDHLTAQSWGTLLLWDKGLLKLEQIVLEQRRSYVMTFAGIARGQKREELEQELLRLNDRVD